MSFLLSAPWLAPQQFCEVIIFFSLLCIIGALVGEHFFSPFYYRRTGSCSSFVRSFLFHYVSVGAAVLFSFLIKMLLSIVVLRIA